ncbi:hypothetical protein [Streptomyces erythrochromogenes]|uniref:hypothetical protein n=1 Tax=Streptomyces erythrochromogenes TaxID=285574 RepID=UPI0036B63996
MRTFPVVMPSGQRYWTVLDDDLEVVAVADRWLRKLRFGRDRAELTTKSYAGGVALYLRWCRSTGRQWPEAGRDLGLLMVWLKYTPAAGDGVASVVQPGPGASPVRGEPRINRVLTYAYRHCYAQRHADAGVPPDVLKELMDHRVITTTQGYYRIGAAKPSTGSPPCSSTGTATASGARRRACWTPSTSAVRSGRSPPPTGSAANPPTSLPAATPARCGSTAWAASTSPPTSPTSPTSKPTSPTCYAAGNG